MKVVLIDDEKSMLLIMKKMLAGIEGIEVTGAFQSVAEAFEFMSRNIVDAAFVDIKMPDGNGLDFARKMMAGLKGIDVVFITSYKKYALEAFEVNAVDYIVKPVTRERLERALNKIIQRRTSGTTQNPAASPAKLYVYCLGGMEIKNANNDSVQLSSAKSYELLAYLLLHKGKSISKWNILEDIFGEMPVTNAETYLNTTIYKLRKALEPYGLKEAIITANESYKIGVKDIYTDFTDFENRAKALTTINESNIEKAIDLDKLFAGQLFGDREYLWPFYEKERLNDIYNELGRKTGDWFLNNSRISDAVRVYKKMVSLNELDEEANCCLMRAYAAKKDRVALIRQYSRYERLLQRELNIRPGTIAANLYSELKRSLE